jgi:hypothetical protein
MEEYVRYKRKNGSIYSWPTKLYIPVPLSTKNEFARLARLNQLSQAELGALVVMHYLAHLEWMVKAIEEYKATEDKLRQDLFEEMDQDAKLRRADRTFGGQFKTSFPEYEDE